MVEVLTVIAIIAVLATLLSASLGNAQRKGRKAVSTSNLRQIAVAFNLYSDDHEKRPLQFRDMVERKYLTERVLICPEDRIHKNWAGLLEGNDLGRKQSDTTPSPGRGEVNVGVTNAFGADVPHSYFKSFDYFDEIWAQIEKAPHGGIAACQLHGIGRQSKDQPPSMDAYQGLVLRALKDGSVINRQIYWSGLGTFSPPASDPGGASASDGFGGPDAPMVTSSSQLPLFVDPSE